MCWGPKKWQCGQVMVNHGQAVRDEAGEIGKGRSCSKFMVWDPNSFLSVVSAQ